MSPGAAAGAIYHACHQVAAIARGMIRNKDIIEDVYQLVYAPPAKLTVSEAFCLLWQDDETGDMSGRRSDMQVQAVAVCSMLLDLILLGKLELDIYDEKGTLWGTNEKALVRMGCAGPLPASCAFLETLASKVEEYNRKEKPRTLGKWVEKLVMGWNESGQAWVDITVESLIAKAIVHKKSVWNGCRFPTDNPLPEQTVKQHLRRVLLEGHDPDVFMGTLLVLAEAADNQCFSRPFMYSVVSKDEYKKAQPRIELLKKELTEKHVGW